MSRPWTLDRMVLPVSAFPAVHQPGTWIDVTPSGLPMARNAYGNNDNFGIQDVLVDPLNPNILLAFTCYNGVWRSTTYGTKGSWVKWSTEGGNLDFGKNWCAEWASDGSYIVCASGNNTSGSPQNNLVTHRSTDGGKTWTKSAVLGSDPSHEPYSLTICHDDVNHVLAANKGAGTIWESTDGAQTWGSPITTGTGAGGDYVKFLLDTDTCLVVPQDTGTARYGTRSGGTWSFADKGGNVHPHGGLELYIDHGNSLIYWPGINGIQKSTDNGATFSTLYNPSGDDQAVMAATATTIYSAFGFPTGDGTNDPKLRHALKASDTAWTEDSTPAAMTQGPKRIAVTNEGANYYLIAGCWNGGLLRYYEVPA